MKITKQHFFYISTVVLYSLVIIKLSIMHWFIAPPLVDNLLLIWLLRTLPLLIFLPALILKLQKGFIWLCFVLLFYFITASVELVQNFSANNWFDTISISLLFISSMLYFKYWKQSE